MIDIKVTSVEENGRLAIRNTGRVSGNRTELREEMTSLFHELYNIDAGATFIAAFEQFLEEHTEGEDDD